MSVNTIPAFRPGRAARALPGAVSNPGKSAVLRLIVTILMLSLLPLAAIAADTVTLTTGETLTGPIAEQTDDRVVLDHPVLGRLTIARDNIAELDLDTPAPAEADEPEAEPEPGEDQDPEPEAETGPQPQLAPPPSPVELIEPDPTFLEDWDASLSLGFSGTQGNSETLSFHSKFDANKKTERDRWIYDASYFYGTDRGRRNRNEFDTELTKDWLFPDSPWFYFAKAGYEYDEFEDWQHRTSTFGGIGYNLFDTDELEVVLRGGAGGTYEINGDSGFTPEALFGASVIRWAMTDNQTLKGSATLYPDLEELSEYRITSSLEWIIKIDHADGLSVKLGLDNEYESSTGGDSKHSDTKYYGAIVFDF